MQEIWGFFWVEFFLGLLSRQGSYGFFGYFPQKVAVFGSELACIQGRGVTATSLRKLRFLGLNWPAFKAGELRLLPSESCGFWVCTGLRSRQGSYGYFPQKVAVFGSELASWCFVSSFLP